MKIVEKKTVFDRKVVPVTSINSRLLLKIFAKLLWFSLTVSFCWYKSKNEFFFSSREYGENVYAENTKNKGFKLCLVKTVHEQALEQSH